MKLSIIIVICSIFQVNAASFAQQLTVKQQGISFKQLFREIKKQTGYEVIYADRLLNDRKTLNVSFQNSALSNALTTVFEGLPVDFVIEENSIILSKKMPVNPGKEKLSLAFEVKGMVSDENNRPIPGVTVKAATSASASGRSSSAQLLYTVTKVTGADGAFTMNLNPTDEYLVFSFIGYETKIVKIADTRFFKVNLVISKNPLDEVQVIAYGTTTKRLSTGSVSALKREQIEKQPVSNPLMVMEGRLPGVYVSESAGIAGGGINLQIRGTNTISAGRNPLYIVDGVPFSAVATEQSAGGAVVPTAILGGLGTFTPFDNIPTSDIESIDVLKDADATAIYGSRAANGVVLITTRKGKAGKMKISANVYSGVSKVASSIDLLNTEQYTALRRQAFANDNIAITPTNAVDLTYGDGYTNFFQTIMGNTAHFTDGSLSVSGGNLQTQYLVSGNYRHQSAVLPGNFSDKKATLHFNVQSRSENNKFSINLSGSYTKNVNDLPAASIATYYSLPPNLQLYNADESYYWLTNNAYTNPLAALQAPKNVTTDNVTANSTLKYDILPGLSFKTDLGFNRINFRSLTATTKAAKNPFSATAATGSSTAQENFNETYTVEPQLNYSRQIGPGKLDALLGGTYQYNSFQQPYLILGTFTNDALYRDLGSTTITSATNGSSYAKYISLFGRVNYSVLDRYIFSFNGRRDGSSRFGSGKKFGNFGSIGAAWIFTEEGFLKDNLNWLSFGKLRGSYGTLGNDQIGDYQYISTYGSSPLATTYNGVATLVPSNLANQEFGWESTKKLEFAADLNFLKDRVMFTAAWYQNISSNLLIYTPLPPQTGYAGFTGNLPAEVKNTGLEFTLDTKNIQKKDFSWSTSLNVTVPKNKVSAFPGLAGSVYASSYVVGQPVSVVQGYHFTGFLDGVAQFQDLDGSNTISAGSYTVTGKGDYAVIGNTDPKIYGGLNNSLRYKNFQLDFLFQFVKKDGYSIYNSSATPGMATNVVADVLNQPFKYTTVASSPAGAGFTRYKTSDAAFGDASFIRLKNVSLNYNFNNAVIRKIGLQNLNVYLRGQNLLTFTKYLGFDPETLGTAIPPSKLISLGLQTSF